MKLAEAVAMSNVVAVAYVDAIVVGCSWPARSALSWSWLYIYSALIKSNRDDIKVALYCELKSIAR